MISAIGIGLPAFRAGLRANASPVKRIDRFDPAQFRSKVAAQVDDFDPADHMDARAIRGLDRFSQFGLATGRMAMADAGLVPGVDGAPDGERIGIYLGSALGGIAFAEGEHEKYLARGLRSVSPTLALAVFGGAAPANLGIALDVRGPILSTANSCASGAVAIGEAMGAIRDRRDRRGDRRRRRVPAVPARVRRLRPHPGPRAAATTTTRRTRRGRWTPSATGSSWARAPGCSCWRPPRSPAGAAPGPTAG